MKLAIAPMSFDVMLTENMFGDILSDEAGAICGSLGLLPSASLGEGPGLFEPVHGSAPTLAGKNIANPVGAIASAAMLLADGLGLREEAALITRAIEATLAAGARAARHVGLRRSHQRPVDSTDDGALDLASRQAHPRRSAHDPRFAQDLCDVWIGLARQAAERQRLITREDADPLLAFEWDQFDVDERARRPAVDDDSTAPPALISAGRSDVGTKYEPRLDRLPWAEADGSIDFDCGVVYLR